MNFGVIPVSHSYGLSNLITPLLDRGVPLVLSRDRMPRAVLDDLARTKATVFPGMPVFYQAFAQMESVPALPQPAALYFRGSAVAAAGGAKISRAIRPIDSLVLRLVGMRRDLLRSRSALLEQAGFVGQPMQGVSVRSLDPEGAMSRIEVLSAAAGDGYFPEPDEEKLADGRFVPDDLLTASRPRDIASPAAPPM